MLKQNNAIYVEGYQPGCIGRITELHGVYYSQCWGVGAEFEILMARELCDFCEQYDMESDLLVSARADERLIGSLAVQGNADRSNNKQEARLRWFILDPIYQGQGIGKALLQQALHFCRQKAFSKLYLWTVDGLPQSRHLYEAFGFHVVAREVDARYGTPLISLKMEMTVNYPAV
ncbi:MULTISPECIES: GNAT family N-acetyltransferase [Nostocales]|uniref:Acetyltransferase n=3 Tax=Nostocales TaxID=1161 RepID=A0A0C1R650_9CYAN|nr:GNAT family N-acetyltransferase [Tolypothrix bouteillei]KAF3887248.1 GNAT family N-acetyltransferase [Tolypothrix bouteillei VB521301]